MKFIANATDLALRAFEARPTRPESLADLSRAAREAGQNETAAMFARRGLATSPSDDLLFVESWARDAMREDLSIAGYYSVDPETRAAAARVCDELGLDRGVSQETRNLARQNLEFYLKAIGSNVLRDVSRVHNHGLSEIAPKEPLPEMSSAAQAPRRGLLLGLRQGSFGSSDQGGSSGISSSLYASVAEDPFHDARTAPQGQLPQLCEYLQTTGHVDSGAVQGMWGCGQSNASSQLRQTFTGDLALSPVPYEAPFVFSSWRSRRLTFTPPDGYNAMAPSVTRHGDHILAAQRTVNYKVDERGYVRVADDLPLTAGAKIHTRTFLIEIDPDTLDCSLRGEILLPADLPASANDIITGFEDTRLFSWRGFLWGLSTVLDQNPDARAEQWLAKIGFDLRMEDARPIHPEGPIQPREKNWIPLVDGGQLRFIYLSDPTRIIDHEGRTVVESIPNIAADHLSGSSQAIPFAGGWLAVVHWRQWFDGWPKYRHRFAWYDAEYRLKKLSPGWVFSTKQPEIALLAGYEYCTGLALHPDGNRFIIGYQIHERESWVGTVDAEEVAATMMLPPPPALAPPNRGRWPPPVAITNTLTEIATSTTASFSTLDDESWVLSQTNRALQDQAAVDRATRMLVQDGLPEHRDRIKNWDTAIALHHARKHCQTGEAILDAGGDRNAAFLPALARFGYGRLLSLNLEERAPAHESGVAYSWGDITDTGLPDRSQDFVACLSVLEHGVDVPRFMREMARILAPGGHLFVSVDYWEVPVSTAHVIFQGSYAGQRWEIFTPASLDDLVGHANRAGLQVVGDVDFRCRYRVAHHLGCSYTFLNLLFRR